MAPKLYSQDKSLSPNQGLRTGFAAHLARRNHTCHNMVSGTLDQCHARQGPNQTAQPYDMPNERERFEGLYHGGFDSITTML